MPALDWRLPRKLLMISTGAKLGNTSCDSDGKLSILNPDNIPLKTLLGGASRADVVLGTGGTSTEEAEGSNDSADKPGTISLMISPILFVGSGRGTIGDVKPAITALEGP